MSSEYEKFEARRLEALCAHLGKTSAEIEQFKADIRAACQRHGISISHEDGHGAFMLERFDEGLMRWFEAASTSDATVRVT